MGEPLAVDLWELGPRRRVTSAAPRRLSSEAITRTGSVARASNSRAIPRSTPPRDCSSAVAPIPNPCQLPPIADPCRFERFQALAQLARSISGRFAADRPRASPVPRRFHPGRFSAPIANSEWRIGPVGVPIRHSLLTIRILFGCTIILNEKNNHDTHFVFYQRKIIGSSNCDSIADQGAPRRIRKPHRWERLRSRALRRANRQ